MLKHFSISQIHCEPVKHPTTMEDNTWSENDDDADISERLRMKIFGATSDEMKNWSALQRLGITYSEFEDGNSIHSSTRTCLSKGEKTERMTGYSIEQIRRSKALRILGTTEDEIYESRAKKLGDIGREKLSRHG